MASLKDRFSSGDLAELSGLSTHMVYYLCRCEVLSPSLSSERHRGLRLSFSFTDIVMARAIARFLEAGASVSALRHALQTLRRKLAGVPVNALVNRRVVIIGGQVHLLESPTRALNLTANGQIAFQFVLETDRKSVV